MGVIKGVTTLHLSALLQLWSAYRVACLQPLPPAVRVYQANPLHDDPAAGIWMLPEGSVDLDEAWDKGTEEGDNVSNGLGAEGRGGGAGGGGRRRRRPPRNATKVPVLGPHASLLQGAAPPNFCAALIEAAEAVGFDDPSPRAAGGGGEPTQERCNGALSWVLDDALCAGLSARVAPLLPPFITTFRGGGGGARRRVPAADAVKGGEWVRRADGAPAGVYSLSGLNPRCRIYRYRAGTGDTFPPHLDDVWPGSFLDFRGRLCYDGWTFGPDEASPWQWSDGARVSQLSFLLYLSTNPPPPGDPPSARAGGGGGGQGGGGETVLYEDDGGEVLVYPKAGDALVFGQSFKLGRPRVRDSQFALLHAGAPLPLGAQDKYVLRSDVLYTLPDNESAGAGGAPPVIRS